MEASRRQPGMLEGLSRFLVQHERCGAGFDVAHPAGLGSGRVSITCRGCGARHEYATATITYEPEAPPTAKPVSDAPPARRSSRIPPRPAPYPDTRQPALPEPEAEPAPVPLPAKRPPEALPAAAGTAAPEVREPEGDERDFWSSPRTTIALLAVAAIAVVIAAISLVNDSNGSDETPLAPTGPSVSSPTPSPKPASRPTPVTLHTSLFSVELPDGWSRRSAGGSLLLEPPGNGRANVEVYFQSSPTLSESTMGRKTARFLRHEVPGASLFPQRTRIDGEDVAEYTARGPGETAIAVNVLRGPYRYLLVRRIFAGAKPHVSLAAGQIVRSFKPN
jgi:hypothetical protein